MNGHSVFLWFVACSGLLFMLMGAVMVEIVLVVAGLALGAPAFMLLGHITAMHKEAKK